MDGISSFPGLIIIATTNHIDRIPPQLCRYGRLTPLYFGYMVKNEIIEMIEFYYEIKLTSEEIERIEIISSKNNLAHSKLKFHIEEEYRNDLEGLIEFLSGAD
jgi:ATP-dependent 26S proteasome regulatory subunit